MMSVPATRYFRKAIVAACSGITLALAFPKFELSWLVFFALVPIFYISRNESGPGAFLLGTIAGFSFNFIAFFWITEAMSNFSDLGFVPSVMVLLLLVAYLAVYFGILANVASMIRLNGLSVLVIPALWVALEFAKSKIISGFPWNDLSWALYRHTTFIQIADTLGSYGVSFVIVLFNWLLFLMLARFTGDRVEIRITHVLAVLVLVPLGIYVYGAARLASLPEPSKTLKVGIIQPSIPQAMKLSGRFMQEMLDTYQSQAFELEAKGVKVMLLPEAAINVAYNVRANSQNWVKQTFSDRGCFVLFGALAREGENYMNSAYVVSPNGETQRYDKVHLVPFGEYIPYSWLLSFIEAIAGQQGSLSEGTTHAILQLDGVWVGVPICYEIIFPEIARTFVNRGADLICTLSNDAWFGKTSGPYQHFAASVFRAIENRVPVIRCANSGVSGSVDYRGIIRLETPIFTRRTDIVEVGIAAQGSVFRVIGSLFAYLCVTCSIVAGVVYAKRMWSDATKRPHPCGSEA
ncbi:MAG: apolipoprotein N-acyltransferase [Candidatus Coatesbacteria bacterium]|nr:apolipoprotein N-acyltransferase [Candidatus Coatesbacteria bacterium]